MPYTSRSRENLLAEGFPGNRVYVTGNPIHEVMQHYNKQITESEILQELHLDHGRYFLLTVHRAENVDTEKRLRTLLTALVRLSKDSGFPVIGSLHPRTASRIEHFGLEINPGAIRLLPPLGFFDFVHLEQHAFCTLTDSGTVQEETCLLGVPNVTIRDVTERPETLECGSNFLTGIDEESIVRAVAFSTTHRNTWVPPWEYTKTDVAATVVRILLSYRIPEPSETAWQAVAK